MVPTPGMTVLNLGTSEKILRKKFELGNFKTKVLKLSRGLHRFSPIGSKKNVLICEIRGWFKFGGLCLVYIDYPNPIVE